MTTIAVTAAGGLLMTVITISRYSERPPSTIQIIQLINWMREYLDAEYWDGLVTARRAKIPVRMHSTPITTCVIVKNTLRSRIIATTSIVMNIIHPSMIFILP